MKTFKSKAVFLLSIVAVGALLFIWQDRMASNNLPPTQSYQPTLSPGPKSSPVASKTGNPAPATLLPEINLSVPFTSQAPSKNWGLPYSEFCEEASSLMAASYLNGWSIPTPAFAEQKMNEIKTFEEKRFGYFKDTTAEETAIILREFYKISAVRVVYDPTIDDIKKALTARKAVIMPAAGRLLGNPYFQSPGPIYHMLVIKGYTKDGSFITNDPGTRNGANYIYKASVIMNAMHDWNSTEVLNGKKVVIVVG